MAPIHDTDVAQERFKQSEWQYYELWEKVEQRFRRQRQIWIGFAVLLFLLISSIPVVKDRWPKWTSISAARKLSQEINRMKKDAGFEKTTYRLKFFGDGSLRYQIEKVEGCSSAVGTPVRDGSLVQQADLEAYRLLGSAQGEQLGIPGLRDSFCYDYLAGNGAILDGDSLVGFAISPANDLTEGRTDRISVMLLSGPSAEVTFE